MMTEQRSDEESTLLQRAAQIDVQVPFGAQARVWKQIEKKRARAAWRLAFPMFLAGAATTALILLFVLPRSPRDHAVVLLPDGTQQAVASGAALPSANGLALVDLRGAGRMVAGPSTLARLDRFESRAVELSLTQGSLLIHVNPRTHGEPFIVRAPGLTARVVGTVLRVAVTAGRATLTVGHGAVEVMVAGGAPHLIRAGEHWPADATDLPSAAELEKLGPADLEGASFSLPKIVSLPSESGLFAAGWQRMRAHDLRGALSLWREQRQRFPGGVLRSEAQTSIIDALVALHEDAQARAEVDDYLRHAATGARSAEMHFVRGTLLYAADRGCRRAAVEFDRALARPAEPWAQKARAARAACNSQ